MSKRKYKEQNFTTTLSVVNSDFEELEDFIKSLPERFRNNEGVVIHKGRNELRKMEYSGLQVVIKSFRRPNIINRLVYGFLRSSKAERSFNHAKKLLEIGVSTPDPIGYLEKRRMLLFFDESYYLSALSTCPYVYDNLFTQDFEYAEEVFRAIGRNTAILHEHGYAHKDYGRLNILFEKTSDGIKLDIVDLNRMHIGPIDMKAGCKNFERLPATPQMHRWMAEEYAEARGFDADRCFELMAAYRSTQPGKIDNLY